MLRTASLTAISQGAVITGNNKKGDDHSTIASKPAELKFRAMPSRNYPD
jgi:hypothetical protein